MARAATTAARALAAQSLRTIFVLLISGVLGNGQTPLATFPAGERRLAQFPRGGKEPL